MFVIAQRIDNYSIVDVAWTFAFAFVTIFLFVGDASPTVRIPVADVQQVQDPDIRQMYLDFCPVVFGMHVCPADFNQLTMGWYLNHSEHPNVAATDGLQFRTCEHIAAGSELTADYTTYSEHAAACMQNGWNTPGASQGNADESGADGTTSCV